MVTSSGILQAYLIQSLASNDAKLSYKELLKRHRNALITHELYAEDGGFTTVLTFYSTLLANANQVLIAYMSAAQKQQLAHDLRITYLLLLAQIEYEFTHQKTENIVDYYQSLKSCGALLDVLNPQWQNGFTEEGTFKHQYMVNKTTVTYLGIALAKEFAEQLVAIGTTKNIKTFVKGLNEKRLYWVWGSSFLKTMLSLIPESFYNIPQANAVVPLPDPYTGSLSWGLYYFRFALNFFLLLKHTCAHPWMSDEEYAIPWQDRFKIQWNMRKFSLLNDSIWGVANFLCFFWLTGKGVLGAVGDAVTIGLLLFDTIVSIWDFMEQEDLHEAQLTRYAQDIKALEEQITALKIQQCLLNDNETNQKNLAQLMPKIQSLKWQLNTLKSDQEQCIANWTLEKISLYNNMAYAIGLMLAFVIMTMPFVPFTAAISLTLGVVGAVICFALTVINNSIQAGIQLYKTNHTLVNYEQKFDRSVQEFKTLVDENQRKLFFLEIRRLDAQSKYQRQMASLQTAHLIRSIIMEVFTPAIIFASVVFFPLNIGLGIIALALGLAMLSSHLIDCHNQVDKQLLTVAELDTKEYGQFCALVSDEKKNSSDHHVFFRKVPVAIPNARTPLPNIGAT